jgi:hypothetical protein
MNVAMPAGTVARPAPPRVPMVAAIATVYAPALSPPSIIAYCAASLICLSAIPSAGMPLYFCWKYSQVALSV